MQVALTDYVYVLNVLKPYLLRRAFYIYMCIYIYIYLPLSLSLTLRKSSEKKDRIQSHKIHNLENKISPGTSVPERPRE